MKKTNNFGLIFVGVIILIGFLLLGFSECSAQEKIPLKNIYSNNRQKGLKPWDPIEEEGKRNSHAIPELFLVRAKDIAGALIATRKAFGHDVILPKENVEDQYWMVVYLGWGTSYRWIIDGLQKTQNKFSLSFSLEPTIRSTLPLNYAWCPLGKLKPGNYELEMVFSKNKKFL